MAGADANLMEVAQEAGTDVGTLRRWQQQDGWRDLMGQVLVKTSGADRPTFQAMSAIPGAASMWGYSWSATVLQQVQIDYHVDHDIKLGSVLYPHVHFRPLTNAAGVVRWGFEYSVSKGHGQTAGFPATTTVYVNFNVPANSLGTHFVAEVATADAIPSTNIEPDSVIHMRVFRDAANAADTYTGAVWCWQADLHYQVQQAATKNKAPNFYV